MSFTKKTASEVDRFKFGLQFAIQQFIDHSACGRAFIEHPADRRDDRHLHAQPLGQPAYRERIRDTFCHRMAGGGGDRVACRRFRPDLF